MRAQDRGSGEAEHAERKRLIALRRIRDETLGLSAFLWFGAAVSIAFGVLADGQGRGTRIFCVTSGLLVGLLVFGVRRANEAARVALGVSCAIGALVSALWLVQAGAAGAAMCPGLATLVYALGAIYLLRPGCRDRFAAARRARDDQAG